MNSFAKFFKEHSKEFAHLPQKERMKECSKLYRAQHGIVMPKKTAKAAKAPKMKKAKGGSILGDIVPFGHLLGLGLDTEKDAHGGSFWDDFKEGIELPLAAARQILS